MREGEVSLSDLYVYPLVQEIPKDWKMVTAH